MQALTCTVQQGSQQKMRSSPPAEMLSTLDLSPMGRMRVKNGGIVADRHGCNGEAQHLGGRAGKHEGPHQTFNQIN